MTEKKAAEKIIVKVESSLNRIISVDRVRIKKEIVFLKRSLAGIKDDILPASLAGRVQGLEKAIERAKIADTNKDDFFPIEKSTKVYLLMEELLKYSILNKEVNNPEIV